MVEKDTRYLISRFYDQAENTAEFKKLKHIIDEDGVFIARIENDIEDVSIYSAELALIFTTNQFEVLNLDTKETISIVGYDYFETYVDAFKLGVQEFDTNFSVSQEILYGAGRDQYLKDLHFNYYHKIEPGGIFGWSSIKCRRPLILTHDVISQFGWYAGLVSKVDRLIAKYPNLFADFDKCDSSEIKEQTKKLKTKQIALLYFYNDTAITRENGKEIAEQFGHTSGDKLYNEYSYFSNNSNRRGKPLKFSEKTLENKIELFKSIVPLLPANKRHKINDEILKLENYRLELI